MYEICGYGRDVDGHGGCSTHEGKLLFATLVFFPMRSKPGHVSHNWAAWLRNISEFLLDDVHAHRILEMGCMPFRAAGSKDAPAQLQVQLPTGQNTGD